MRARARARRALLGETGATSSTRKRTGVSRRNGLSQVGAPGYGTRRCVCACVITRRARARPITARGSPTAGQSASPGQPAAAWSQACCSRAPGLTWAVIVTSTRVANTVDTSWRHGAPRERHTSPPPPPPPSSSILVLCTSISLCRVSSLSLLARTPWAAFLRFCEDLRPSL